MMCSGQQHASGVPIRLPSSPVRRKTPGRKPFAPLQEPRIPAIARHSEICTNLPMSVPDNAVRLKQMLRFSNTGRQNAELRHGTCLSRVNRLHTADSDFRQPVISRQRGGIDRTLAVPIHLAAFDLRQNCRLPIRGNHPAFVAAQYILTPRIADQLTQILRTIARHGVSGKSWRLLHRRIHEN